MNVICKWVHLHFLVSLSRGKNRYLSHFMPYEGDVCPSFRHENAKSSVFFPRKRLPRKWRCALCKIIICIFSLHSSLAMALDKMANAPLSRIPLEDRVRLESLFYKIFNEDHGAYALFGDKPVALSSYFKVTPWENIIELGILRANDETFNRKWKTWEKYRHLFKIKDFILIKEDSKLIDINNIIIINKENFIKAVNNNLSLFERILGHSFNPKEVLKNIESRKTTFVDSIENNQVLWGILLGYGKHNAILYSRWKRPIRNKSSLQYKSIGDYFYTPLIMNSVYFNGSPQHPESLELMEKYRKQRGDISSIYSQGNLLEISLSKLVSELLQK